MASYVLEEADTPVEVFEACRAFCSEMCDDPDCRDTVIYGGNNWYYAYGKSSAKEILEDSAYLAEMTEGIENRPFMVMDDGWQITAILITEVPGGLAMRITGTWESSLRR